MVTVVLVGFSSIMAVVLIAADVEVSATMIGLSLTYIISLSGNLQFMVRQSALVENFMTSVERVIDFGVNTPQEREGEGGRGGGSGTTSGSCGRRTRACGTVRTIRSCSPAFRSRASRETTLASADAPARESPRS
jgi:hypothetical protein